MSRVKTYFSIISIGCAVCALMSGSVARADGDPMEIQTTEFTFQTESTSDVTGSLLADEQGATSEEAVATVTADGDFLLPTYLLPGETATVERTTTVEAVYETPVKTEVAFETPKPAPAPRIESRPVVPARAESSVQTKTVDIARTQTTKKVVAKEDELEALLKQTAPAKEPINLGTAPQREVHPKKILIPLAPLPAVEVAEPALPTRERVIAPSEYADRMTNSLKNGEKMPFLMPHEIRITFYPKASSFSGQALKWVKAFAMAAVQDPRLVVEVRASCAEADLQETRLKLVKEALTGAGLSTHQIVVNYTDRPVDTMLLRAVPRQELTETVITKKDEKLPKNRAVIQKW